MENTESTFQDYNDLAFEIETESALTASKKARILCKTEIAQISDRVRIQRKAIEGDLAVGRSKFVSNSRQLLLTEATKQIKLVQEKTLVECKSRADKNKSEYGKLLQKLIVLGETQISGETTVVCREADKGLIQGNCSAVLDQDKRGVIVQSVDGRIVVSLTMEQRVQQACKFYLPEINAILLPEYELVE